MLSLVQLVLLGVHDRSPVPLVPVVLLVATHGQVVALLLLHLPLGNDLDDPLLGESLGILNPFQGLIDGCLHGLILLRVVLGSLLGQFILNPRLGVFL